MNVREARAILCEMQKWRRGLPPYDGETPETHRPMPHTPEEFGEAIDIAINIISGLQKIWQRLKN